MKIETIKQYSNTYYVSFDYNGAQFGRKENEILQDVTRTANSKAHDRFIEDTNRYSSIPTPKYEECKFEVSDIDYEEAFGNYRVYTVKVKVVWQYVKL